MGDESGQCLCAELQDRSLSRATLECLVPEKVQEEMDNKNVPLQRIGAFLMAENCLLREALVRVLRKRDDVRVVGTAAFSPCALDVISSANPDVVLFDSASIALTGPRLVSRMRQAAEYRKAVMIGMDDDEATFLWAVREGVEGYVLKDASAAEIVRVIRAVAAGEAVCPARFSASLFQCAARDLALSFQPTQDTRFGLSRRGATTGRVDPLWIFKQGDRQPIEPFGTDGKEPCAPHSEKGWGHQQARYGGALPGGRANVAGFLARN